VRGKYDEQGVYKIFQAIDTSKISAHDIPLLIVTEIDLRTIPEIIRSGLINTSHPAIMISYGKKRRIE
jgi:hypothetical protein